MILPGGARCPSGWVARALHGAKSPGLGFPASRAYLAGIMEIVIALIIGFALGYGIREWMSRKRRQAERKHRGLPPVP